MSTRTFYRTLVVAPLVVGQAGAGSYAMSPATDLDKHQEAGSVRGATTFSGTVPGGEPVDMSGHPYCEAAHAQAGEVSQPVVVDGAGRLGDVIVYVKEGLEGRDSPPPEEAAVLDQMACMYAPHVVALQTGQTLVIRNSDATLHNVHVFANDNRGFNVGQPLRGIESRRTFPNPELGIEVKCDIHGWMNAALAVFDHPFFAVSGGDGGFRLDGLPPGEYVIEAWHQTLGTRTQTVVVRSAEVSEPSFAF